MDILNIIAKILEINPWIVYSALFVFSLLFLVAFRELIGWYLKIVELKASLEEIKEEIQLIRLQIANNNKKVDTIDPLPIIDKSNDPNDRFTLDH